MSFVQLETPKWARPPEKSCCKSARARSFGEDAEEGGEDVDFECDLFAGKEGDWIEVIKGNDGRIAVKSDSSQFNIMVWLPGVS